MNALSQESTTAYEALLRREGYTASEAALVCGLEVLENRLLDAEEISTLERARLAGVQADLATLARTVAARRLTARDLAERTGTRIDWVNGIPVFNGAETERPADRPAVPQERLGRSARLRGYASPAAALAAAYGRAGMDRAARLAFATKTLGRPVGSFTGLSKIEIDVMYAQLPENALGRVAA